MTLRDDYRDACVAEVEARIARDRKLEALHRSGVRSLLVIEAHLERPQTGPAVLYRKAQMKADAAWADYRESYEHKQNLADERGDDAMEVRRAD